MNKIKVIISCLCVLLGTYVCNAQNNKPDMVVEGIYGPVRKIEEVFITDGKTEKEVYQFNSSRQITSIEFFNAEGALLIRYEFEYNEKGKLSKSTYTSFSENIAGQFVTLHLNSLNEFPFSNKIPTMSKSGRGDEIATYFYNDLGVLEKVSIMGMEGDDKTEIEEIYTKGFLSKRTEKNRYMSMEYLFDKNGKITELIINEQSIPVDTDNSEDPGAETLQYDKQGRVIASTGDMGRKKYTYNNNGYLAMEQSSDRWWGDAKIEYLNYAYDQHNNWIRRTEKKTGEAYGKNGTTIQRIREIFYDE